MPISDPSEQQIEQHIIALVLKAKNRDEQAFGKLYELYFERIFRFIRFRVSHKETAEDLAEDVFVKAWKSISDVNENSFNAWIYQISKNKVIDYYRQKKSNVDLEEIAGTFESEDNIFEMANTAMDQRNLIQLLKKLAPEQQTIIRLKFIEDLSNSEIAGITGKSEGAIRVIQHRAIQKLQELFNDEIRRT